MSDRTLDDRASWLGGLPRWVLILTSGFTGTIVGWLIAEIVHFASTDKLPEWITAIGTILLALLTLGLALVGISQIKRVARQQRKWTTLQVCDRYDTDVVINGARDVLWRHFHGEKQPINEVKHAALRLLNYFDAIAIGIHQGLYIEKLAKDHIGTIVRVRLAELRSLDDQQIKELLGEMDRTHACLSELLAGWATADRVTLYRDDER